MILCADIQPTITAAIIGAAVAFTGIIFNIFNARILRINSNRQEIYKKMNGFYGPMKILLNECQQLFEAFAYEHKEVDFTTLHFLLEGKHDQLSKTDHELLKSIIQLGIKMENIIETNSSLIDNQLLFEMLVDLAVHYKTVRMAYFRQIEPTEKNKDIFKDKAFPEIISHAIQMYFDLYKADLSYYNTIFFKKRPKKEYKQIFEDYKVKINSSLVKHKTIKHTEKEKYIANLLKDTPYYHILKTG